MKKDYINNRTDFLMGLLASNGVSSEEYAKFLTEFDISDFRRQVAGEGEDSADEDMDYVPMDDADEKTLKLKIQLRNVSKPPMWREVLVPAEFNFSQLHYIIQAVMGLDNCHLWQFEQTPYDREGPLIGIPRENQFSFGLEECRFHADQTPLTGFLACKGDKLVYVYDFRLDWIFNITVTEVLPRQGEVAECRKYKSELQALDDVPPFLYEPLRAYSEDSDSMSKSDVKQLMQNLRFKTKDMLDAYIDDRLIDLEFVNEELAEIPDEWEPID